MRKATHVRCPSVRDIVSGQREFVLRLNQSRSRQIGSRRFLIDDPLNECWGCGEFAPLQRSHIVARSRGGTVDPTNFLLLCDSCHRQQPDLVAPETLWEWLLERKHWSHVAMRHVRVVMLRLRRLARKLAPTRSTEVISAFSEWLPNFQEMAAKEDSSLIVAIHQQLGIPDLAGGATDSCRIANAEWMIVDLFAHWFHHCHKRST